MVEIKGLNKFYGKFIALNNLDLHIDNGSYLDLSDQMVQGKRRP